MESAPINMKKDSCEVCSGQRDDDRLMLDDMKVCIECYNEEKDNV